MKKILCAFFSVAAISVCAEPITVATGKSGKGYSPLFQNINAVCGDHVPLKEINTDGGLDNVSSLADKTALMGIVPIDVLQQMGSTDLGIKRLQAVAALNSNMLHMVTLSKGFEVIGKCTGKMVGNSCLGFQDDPVVKVLDTQADLAGLTVGLVGSAQLTGRTYVMTKVKFVPVDIETDVDAMKALKAGQIHAYMTMSPWPTGVIKDLTTKDGVKLLRWTLPKEGNFNVVKKSYKKLGQFGISFLASQNLLMTRAIDPHTEMGQNISKLQSCIGSNLSKFKDTPTFVPSWDEVNSIEIPEGVPAWVGRVSYPPKGAAPLKEVAPVPVAPTKAKPPVAKYTMPVQVFSAKKMTEELVDAEK